jgi:hypothetical protein
MNVCAKPDIAEKNNTIQNKAAWMSGAIENVPMAKLTTVIVVTAKRKIEFNA